MAPLGTSLCGKEKEEFWKKKKDMGGGVIMKFPYGISDFKKLRNGASPIAEI
jgi:hypothetical protein